MSFESPVKSSKTPQFQYVSRMISYAIKPTMLSIFSEEALNFTEFRFYSFLAQFGGGLSRHTGLCAHLLSLLNASPAGSLRDYYPESWEGIRPCDEYLDVPKEQRLDFYMKKTIFFCSHIAERSLAPVQKQIFDALLSEITHIGNCIQRATIASVLLKNFNDDLTIALVKILPTKDRSIAVEPRALTDLGLSALPSTLPDGGHAWVEIGTKDGSSFVYDPWLNPTVIYGVVEHQVLLKIRDCHFGLLRRDEITEDFCMQFNIAKKMMQHNSPGLIGLFSDPKMPFETFQSSLSVLSQKQSKIRPFSGSAGFLAACALGNWAAAMTLLLSGVDPDYKDLKQRGASHYVAMRRGVTGLFLEVYEYHYGHAPTDIDIKKCMEGRAFVLKQLLYLDVSFSIENVTGNSAESLIFAQKTKFSAPGEEKDCAYFTAFEAGLQDCRARLEVVKSREIDEASAGAGSSALRCSFLEQFGLNHPGATFPKALDLD